MNQNAQFEERQRYEKQMFEHQSRDFAKTNLKYMDEVHSVFVHLSEVVDGFSSPEDKADESPIKD